jgi:outer membrane biosynthesis protein TonB
MFTELVESRRGRSPLAGQSLLSFMLHLGLGVGAIGVTRGGDRPATSPPRPHEITFELPAPAQSTTTATATPTAPVLEPTPNPALPPIEVPVVVPTGIPPVLPGAPVDPKSFFQPRAMVPGAAVPGDSASAPGIGSAVLLPAEADEVPRLARGARCRGDYPGQLRALGLAGSADLQFVIDRDGRVDPGSVQVTRATHPAFGEAARGGLARPECRYTPGSYRGAPVRALVRQRATFRLDGP